MFLLEPSVDPAVEQQAIGRVHRIGQARPVTVFRLITADTVEARAPRARAAGEECVKSCATYE